MLENMSMLKKGLWVIAAPLIFQLLFIAALFKSQADARVAQDSAIHTKDVIAQGEMVSRLLVQSQSSVRALVVTGVSGFAEDFQLTLQQVPEELARLRGMVIDNPGQELRVDEIAAKAAALGDWLSEVAGLATSGGTAEAATRIRSLDGKRADDEIRELISAFLHEEERLDKERREQLQVNWVRQNWFLAAAAALTIAFGIGLVVLFSRTFAGRVGALADNAQRLADAKPLARPIGGNDEVGRLDAVFHRMAQTLREREHENEMFIYSVSHDLRSPLVNLQGFGRELQFACDDLRGLLAKSGMSEGEHERATAIIEEDFKGSINFILNAVTRLSAIIDALLRLSRAGRVEYRWQRVDVESIANRVAQALHVTAEERGAEVTVGPLPEAWGDPTAIEQIFANLTSNAINYLDPSRPGRIEIGARGGPRPLDGARRLQTYYVKDNGLGIPEAHRPKLFLAFQRLHPHAAKGEGIGLAVIRRVVERHGGKIWVESEAGAGSTFFVSLPADAASEPAGVGREQSVYGQGDGGRINGEYVA